MVAVDDVIWDVVKNHTWKYQKRDSVIGIIWHATRSGIIQYDAPQEYSSTLNWFRSPNNVVKDDAGNPWYGGMSNYVIGGGRVCLAVPESLSPRFSAGVHDYVAISVEVAQSVRTKDYDPRDIELCHVLAADLSQRYGFPLGRIPFVDGQNHGWPGEVGHEDTQQGRDQGKSDPGPLFWLQYGEDMTPEEVEAIVNRRLDEVLPVYYRKLTRQYWDREAEGAFSDLPDEEVVEGIQDALGEFGPLPEHTHIPGGVAP